MLAKTMTGAVARLALLAGAFALAAPAKAQTTYTWAVDANGTWDTSSLNWRVNGTGPLVAYASTATNIAQFGDVITASRTVAVQAGGITAGQIQFTNGGTFTYTLGTASNPITLDNGASDAVVSVGRGFVGTANYSGVGGNTITGSTLFYTNGLSLVNNGAFGTTNLTIAGIVDRATAGGGITVSGQGNTTISGAISLNTTGGITKNGSGTLNLTSTASAFTGGLTVNSGVLSVGADTNFGAAANGIGLAGGTLRFTATTTLGASRVITVTAASGIDVGAVTATFAATGQITGSGALLLSTTSSSTGGTYAVTGANTGYTGLVTVGAPAAQLVGSVLAQRNFSSTSGTTLAFGTSGSLSGATGVTVSNSALLTITQPTTAIVGRLGTAPLTFNNGGFQYNTSSTAAITDSFGATTATGLLTVSGSSAAGNAAGTAITLASLARTDNATLFIRGSTSGAGSIGGPASTGVQYKLGTAPALIGTGSAGTAQIGIVPWAAGSISSNASVFMRYPVTYDTNGFRVVNITTELNNVTTSALFASAGTTDNVNVTSAITIAVPGGGKTVNSLSIQSTTTLSGSSADAVTLTSGYLATGFAPLTVSGPAITFAATGYVHTSDNITVSTTSRLTGGSGVVVSSVSTSYALILNHTVASTFTGGLFVNGVGRVQFTANNQLGNDGSGNAAGIVTLAGGQLIFNPATTSTVSLNDGSSNRPISVDASNGTIGTGLAAAVLQIPGTISGAGQIQFGGGVTASATGAVELTNTAANTYTGGTLVSTGILRISNANQLGTGPVLLNGGTLQAAAGTAVAFANPVTVVASSTLSTQDGSLNFTGGLFGSGGTSGASATGFILTKTGSTSVASALVVSGAGNYAGGVTVNQGSFTISGNGRLPELGAVSITANAALTGTASNSFNINNSAVNIADRTGRATNLTLANGSFAGGSPTVNLTTNAAGSSFTLGTLTVSAGSAANPNNAVINLLDGGAGNNSVTFLSIASIPANATLAFNGTSNLGGTGTSGSRIFFRTAPTLSGGVIPNTTFTGFGGSGQATYDAVRGIVLFVPPAVSGNLIDNIATSDPNATNALPINVATIFTTSGNYTGNASPSARANTGASINRLILDGADLTLFNLYAAQAGNATTANGTLALTEIVSQTAAHTIFSEAVTAPTVSFGAAAGKFTLTTDLTLVAAITLAGTNGFTKTGAGVLTVNGPVTLTGGIAASAGTASLNGAVASGNTVALSNSAVLNVALLTTFGTTSLANTSSLNLVAGGTVANLTGTGTLAAGANPLTVSSTAPSTFSGALTGGTTFTKSGSGVFTLSPTNTLAFAGATTITGGTLVIGNANAAPILSNYALNGGTIDINGQSPTAAVPTLTGTANGVTNSNTSSPVTIAIDTQVNTSLGVAFSGNVIVNKTGPAQLTLTGTGGVSNVTTTGVVNVNEGTLLLTAGGLGVGTGTSITVASGAIFRLTGASASNAGTPFGTITLNGGTWENTGTSYFDPTFARLVYGNGGSVSVTATGNPFYHFTAVSGGITVLASGTTAQFGVGTPPVNSVYNDTGATLPISVAAGTTPSGIDFDSRLSLNSGTNTTFTKTGAGVFQLSNTGNTWSGTVNGGTVQLNGASTATSTISGALAVNATGVLRGNAARFGGAVTVNSGGYVQGGSIANPLGTLTGGANLTLTNNGGIRSVVNGSSQGSLINMAAGVLNLNPGAGNTFVIDVVSDASNPLVAGNMYSYIVAQVAAANNIQVNGVATTASQTIDPSLYTVNGAQPGYTLSTDTNNTQLVLSFTAAAVPEPASLLAVGGLALGGVRWARRRRAAKGA